MFLRWPANSAHWCQMLRSWLRFRYVANAVQHRQARVFWETLVGIGESAAPVGIAAVGMCDRATVDAGQAEPNTGIGLGRTINRIRHSAVSLAVDSDRRAIVGYTKDAL